MRYARKISNFALLVLFGLSMSSCGKSEGYKNELEKGKNVDSVTFDIGKNGSFMKNVTITKDDSFTEAIRKIDSNGFEEVFLDCGRYVNPYYAKEECIEQRNGYEYIREADMVSYDHSFIKGNTRLYDNESGKKTLKKEYLDRGAYYYYDLSNGSIDFEFATNYIDDQHFIKHIQEGDAQSFYDNDEAIYIKINGNEEQRDLVYSEYKYDNFKYIPYEGFYSMYNQMGKYTRIRRMRAELESIGFYVAIIDSGIFKDIDNEELINLIDYKGSFEITSNYIIFNVERRIEYIDYLISIYRNEDIDSYNSLLNDEEFMERLNNTYSLEEIWFNYRNAKDVGLTWSYYKNEVFEKNELYDLKYSYEAYELNLSENEIKKEKDKFLNKCKDNNVLDKYQFNKVERKTPFLSMKKVRLT